MQITSSEIFEYLSNHDKIKNGLSRRECLFVESCIDKRNYLQILYDYTPNILLCILEMAEQREEYLECQEIVNTINNHNKVSGLNIKTKIDYDTRATKSTTNN